MLRENRGKHGKGGKNKGKRTNGGDGQGLSRTKRRNIAKRAKFKDMKSQNESLKKKIASLESKAQKAPEEEPTKSKKKITLNQRED